LADKRIILAVIAGAQGIGGEVRLKLFAESLDSLKLHKAFEVGGKTLTLKSVRQTSKMPVARFAEITDRNGAEALRGAELTIPRDALPPLAEGEYYHIDLVGLPCVTECGEPVGEVIAVENFGAGDILDIRKPDGKDFMVPIRAVTVSDTEITLDSDFLP
jgi:16S rRNA processing protein RimM